MHTNHNIPKTERIGTIVRSNQGELVKCIDYANARSITIEFCETGYVTKTEWSKFIRGSVRDVLYPSVYGIACFGDGPYTASCPAYRRWFDMVRRCYDPKWQQTHPAYVGTQVCEEWLNYQNFAKWYEQQNLADDIDWELDKDLLHKGQKVYSPANCCFLPTELNLIISTKKAIRGDYPIGVSVDPTNPKKYLARLTDNSRVNGTYKFYKLCDTPEEAFAYYKVEKEKWIKEQAEKFKRVLDPRAYEALMHYEILITD